MRVRLFPMGGPPLTKDAKPVGWHVTLEQELPRGGTQLIFTWDGLTKESAIAQARRDLDDAFQDLLQLEIQNFRMKPLPDDAPA